MDWSGTPDDPHGYKKLRSAVDCFAAELVELGMRERADRLRDAQAYIGMPSEWMGEIASDQAGFGSYRWCLMRSAALAYVGAASQ